MSGYEELLTSCEEDIFSTTHSFWSLATLYDSLASGGGSFDNPLKLSIANSLTGLQHLVVLGLCRLDDDKTLLRHAAKAIQKQDGKRYSELMGMMKVYRSAINQVKDQHRKKYIAHTEQKIDFDKLPEIPPLHDLVKLAIETFEEFAGEQADLLIKTADGWEHDLREWTFNYDNPHKL